MADNTVAADTTLYAKFSQIGVYGDANNDGQITVFDLNPIILKIKQGNSYTGLAGQSIPDCQTSKAVQAVYGDANDDGKISVFDLNPIILKIKQGNSYTGLAGTDMDMVKD